MKWSNFSVLLLFSFISYEFAFLRSMFLSTSTRSLQSLLPSLVLRCKCEKMFWVCLWRMSWQRQQFRDIRRVRKILWCSEFFRYSSPITRCRARADLKSYIYVEDGSKNNIQEIKSLYLRRQIRNFFSVDKKFHQFISNTNFLVISMFLTEFSKSL